MLPVELWELHHQGFFSVSGLFKHEFKAVDEVGVIPTETTKQHTHPFWSGDARNTLRIEFVQVLLLSQGYSLEFKNSWSSNFGEI